MPCYKPLTGYRSRTLNPSGSRSIVFNADAGFIDKPVTVPCGKCIGCRLEYSRQWAIRCVHEASLHDENSFITLTFNDENLPSNLSVNKEDVQKFFKRLRKALQTKKIRYFACGEYGDKNQRPHYHAIIFGHSFPDKQLWSKKNGHLLFRSKQLEQAWPYGFSTIGHVTFESAAYVARYVMKKRKGDDDYEDPNTGITNRDYYSILDKETGELHYREREFVLMSRGRSAQGTRGIGFGWLQRFKQDTDKDYITLNGQKMSLPKYYDQLLKEDNELEMAKRKFRRQQRAKESPDNTRERLDVREKVKQAQVNLLVRDEEFS